MRLVLILFTLLVVPLVVVSCFPGSCGDEKERWMLTYSSVSNKLIKPDSVSVYKDGDTLRESVVMSVAEFTSKAVSGLLKPSGTSAFSAMACDPVLPGQVNLIRKLIFGLAINGNLQHPDTSIGSSLQVGLPQGWFNWRTERQSVMSALQSDNTVSYMGLRFDSPHSGKDIQLVVWAVKQSGDTLKGMSSRVYCK